MSAPQRHIRTVESIFLFLPMSPFVNDSNPGISPGSVYTLKDVTKGFSRIRQTLDHVAHEFLWIAPDIEEFKTSIVDERAECLV